MKAHDLEPTRHSLVNRLKDLEDQRSWQAFFDTYWRLIYNVALRSGLSETEAQDVVQETVLTVTRKIQDFRVGPEGGSFRGWLLQITRWRALDQLRKRGRVSGDYAAAAEDAHDTSVTPVIARVPDPASLQLDAAWDAEWARNLMEVALEKVKQQVDPEEYQIFDLHVVQQTPALTTARRLGVNLNRVYFAKYKVSRLVKREVKRLEREGL